MEQAAVCISNLMGTVLDILVTLALVLCVRRRVPLGRGLLLAFLIFLRRLDKSGWFLVLFLAALVLHLFAHMIDVAWQAAVGMF